jgi:acetamidase/formamidase
MIPEFGALTGTYYTATPNDPLPEVVRKIDLDEEWVYWSPRVKLPYRPHIGTRSCSPEIDLINSLTPDNHGGNMDLPDMGPGSVTYLPVRSQGARLFIGDAHACQGDGEVCGIAVEYPTTTTIRVDLIKGWTIEWPRLEREDFIMAIGSTCPLEDATRIAYRELIRWMVVDYGFDKWSAMGIRDYPTATGHPGRMGGETDLLDSPGMPQTRRRLGRGPSPPNPCGLQR